MTEHFDRSAAEMPFLLRYQEPGPAPIILAGHYDPVAQRWVPDNHLSPHAAGPTHHATSQPTTHSTAHATTLSTTQATYFNSPDTSPDTNYDTNHDTSHDTHHDSRYD
jgi:hypothetical protein